MSTIWLMNINAPHLHGHHKHLLMVCLKQQYDSLQVLSASLVHTESVILDQLSSSKCLWTQVCAACRVFVGLCVYIAFGFQLMLNTFFISCVSDLLCIICPCFYCPNSHCAFCSMCMNERWLITLIKAAFVACSAWTKCLGCYSKIIFFIPETSTILWLASNNDHWFNYVCDCTLFYLYSWLLFVGLMCSFLLWQWLDSFIIFDWLLLISFSCLMFTNHSN